MAGSPDLEDPNFTGFEERVVVEVLDVERETELFGTWALPDLVTAGRSDLVLPVTLVARDGDVERRAWVEEKLFPTFRIFDRARTLDAFWLVKLFL